VISSYSLLGAILSVGESIVVYCRSFSCSMGDESENNFGEGIAE